MLGKLARKVGRFLLDRFPESQGNPGCLVEDDPEPTSEVSMYPAVKLSPKAIEMIQEGRKPSPKPIPPVSGPPPGSAAARILEARRRSTGF